jgi:RNA recognition motif. (a.k.a. RRM, RBD, or RNP domain)
MRFAYFSMLAIILITVQSADLVFIDLISLSLWLNVLCSVVSQRIYVGNLPMDVREKDVEDVFYKYGRIR